MTKQAEADESEEGANGPEPETTSASTADHEEGAQEATGSPPRRRQRWTREEAARQATKGGQALKERRRKAREEEELVEALSREGAAAGLVAAGERRTRAADSAIILALEREAKKGDVQAARAVLDWRRLDSAAGVSPESLALAQWIEQLPTALQAALRDLILDLVRSSQAEKAESPAQQQNREGSVETVQSLPQPPATALAEPEATPPSDGTPTLSTARTPQSARDSAD